jgi:hypothetical protein
MYNNENAIEPQHRADPEEILKFVNDVRKAGQADILHALLPSIPQDSEACLIARNLNFHCDISQNYALTHSNRRDEIRENNGYMKGEMIWVVSIPNAERGNRIVERLGFEKVKEDEPEDEGVIADYFEGTEFEDAEPEKQREEYALDNGEGQAYGVVSFILPARLARAAAAFDLGADKGYELIGADDLAPYREVYE